MHSNSHIGASIRSLLLLQGIPDAYSQHNNLSALTPSDSLIQKDCAPWAQSLHLHLLSAQPTSETDKPDGEFFGASIPLSTAMHPNQQCILAHQHNGKTLTQTHGFPLRCVVPGHAGARWVKWLRGLRISKEENDSHPMKDDYKILSPPQNISQSEKKEWKEKMMGENKDKALREEEMKDQESMQRLGMGSAIESPFTDEEIKGGSFIAKGYAVGQDGEHTLDNC
jgi:sulfite oxidase